MQYNGNTPIRVLMKRADKTWNKIIIPKFIIEKFSRDFLMEIYEDGTMVLKPIMKKEE